MRKDVLLPGLALFGGLAGFGLRRWQLASAFQPELGLFVHWTPATIALAALMALVALAFFLPLLGWREGPEEFLPAFGCPQAGQMTLQAAAGLLMMAAGALGVREGLSHLQLWRITPELDRQPTQFTFAAALAVTALLCVLAGVAVLGLGKMAYRGELSDAGCRMAPVPAAAGLFWLFITYLSHSTEPVLMRYLFTLLAAGLLTLAHYRAAGFLFGRPRRRGTVFCALMGVVTGLTSLADGLSLFNAVVTLAFALSALALARALLANSFGPAWGPEDRMPLGAEDDESKDTAAGPQAG